MKRIKAFGGFWYDFIVDDWRVAVAVVVALAITFGVARTTIPAWWVLPATVSILLPLSLWRAPAPGTPAARRLRMGIGCRDQARFTA